MPKNNSRLIRVLLAGAEFNPLAKAGGLGDVLGSLPSAIKSSVESVTVALPFHAQIKKSHLHNLKRIGVVVVPIGKSVARVSVWQATTPGSQISLLLFHNTKYLSRGRIYQGTAVHDPLTGLLAKSKPGQNIRYLMFSFAVYEWLKQHPTEFNVIHCHDYHTSPLIALTRTDNTIKHIHTLLTVHNLGIVGECSKKYIRLFQWSAAQLFGTKEYTRVTGPRLIHLGLTHASAIVAVSPQYTKEILTPKYGHDLAAILKKRRASLFGILNGLDTRLFNPATEKNIQYNYSSGSLKQKLNNKLVLQKKCGLPVNPRLPVIGLVSRLTSQKGLDLFIELLPRLEKLSAQFIFTGTGHPDIETAFRQAQKKFPSQFYFRNQFDIPFAQQVYAGSDMFLMPSQYEPCGLGQLIAMRYGSVPIVRATGGLKDTVHDGKNGFVFTTYSSQALWRTLNRAIRIYSTQPSRWRHLQTAGMRKDYSWHKSARQYIKLYTLLITNKI